MQSALSNEYYDFLSRVRLVSVDTGRSGSKILNHEKKPFFVPSRFKKGKNRKMIGRLAQYAPTDIDFKYLGKDGMMIEVPEWYFIGELAVKESKTSTSVWSQSKVDPKTLYLILASLFRAGYGSDKFTIVSLIPYGTFEDQEIDRLTDMIEGVHVVEINSQRFTYEIERLFLIPECVAAYYALPVEWTDGKYVHLIDVGARTMTFCVFNPDGELIESQTTTIPVGMETEKFDDDRELAEFLIDEMSKLNWDDNEKGILVPIGGKHRQVGEILLEVQPEKKQLGRLNHEIRIIEAKDIEVSEQELKVLDEDAGRYANAAGAWELVKDSLIAEAQEAEVL